ncbi:DgyrCDS6466 [Dimorphilus gyrociliatus]|uniref:DgyrCDS6466 n=1 Tax=Dimorphilus gyrociliatus TaxID=2664684 RepID=A0A7I8VN57_9ANNE|nr:DgyrCDS6466 [Dimorphilus gyrociliatus]
MNVVEKCQKILRLFLFGAKDALQGTVVILKLDETNKLKNTEKHQIRTGSVLEQRRRERLQESGIVQTHNETPKIWRRVVDCCIWNGGIFLVSLLAFDYLLLPNLQSLTSLVFGNLNRDNFFWSFLTNFLSWSISALWILPLFIISKVLNTFWFQDIADEAYRVQRGRASNQHKISDSLSDTVFSLVMQSLFLVQIT